MKSQVILTGGYIDRRMDQKYLYNWYWFEIVKHQHLGIIFLNNGTQIGNRIN